MYIYIYIYICICIAFPPPLSSPTSAMRKHRVKSPVSVYTLTQSNHGNQRVFPRAILEGALQLRINRYG